MIVNSASLRRFYRVPTISVLSKTKENVTNFHLKNIVFTALKKCSILNVIIILLEMVSAL